MISVPVGRRKRGKTTFGLYLARKSPKRIIFDPRGLIGCTTRFQTASEIEEAFVRLMWPRDNDENDALDEIVITPLDDVQGAFFQVSREVRSIVRAYPNQGLTYLVDEVRFVKLLDKDEKAFDWILRCGDPGHVHVVLTCHRLVDVHPDIRGIADHFVFFQTTEENDLKMIAEQCGDHVRRKLENLDGDHAFLQYDMSVGALYECTNAAAWFTPLADRPGALPPSDPIDELPRRRTLFDKPKLF